jgi:hypothetical protein
MANYAFVTLLTSDAYLPGALTLAGALRDIHPSPAVSPEVDFQTVCLVTPESVDVSAIKQLRRAYDVVVGVEIIAQEDDKGLKLLGRSSTFPLPSTRVCASYALKSGALYPPHHVQGCGAFLTRPSLRTPPPP